MVRKKRKEHQVAQTREAILDAATQAFAERGFEAATMQDIARAAHYTAPSLYNYFKSKAQILQAVFERLHATALAIYDEPSPSGLSFSQRLELLMIRQFEHSEQNADVIKLVLSMQSGGAMPKPLVRRQLAMCREHLLRLTTWLNRESEGERLGKHSAEDLAFFLWGLGHATHIRTFVFGGNLRAKNLVPVLLDFFLYGAWGTPKSASKRASKKKGRS